MAKKVKKIVSVSGFVTYLRTSDEDVQSPERSHNAQRRDIGQRLKPTYDIPDLGEYVDNYTGTSSDREHYQQMLTDARAGKFSHVFAATPDRFGREDVEALRAIDEMTKLGITVRFASHPDLDPADADDRMYLNILFGMARRESAVTGRRTRGGMVSKLMLGGWPWMAPDGYLNKEIKLSELGEEEQGKHARYKRWVEIDPEQAKCWRYAWELLLTNSCSLGEICEALSEKGYHTANGRPFVEVRITKTHPEGKRTPYIQALSWAFRNWFYAGWVVVSNEFANILPKTIKGEWEPTVSTEDFERGLQILARRQLVSMPRKKHFYLLQGLIYLRERHGAVRKLRCSTPNAKRASGGVPYYCVPSCEQNYLCHIVDGQIAEHLSHIQLDPDLIPDIREAYLSDIERYTKHHSAERKALEVRLTKLEEKETNLWRGYSEHGMKAHIFEKLTRECEQEQQRIKVVMQAMVAESASYVENLDAALQIISEIAARYPLHSIPQQRAILLHMVERVLIDHESRIVDMELKPPFSYLVQLGQRGTTGGEKKQTGKMKTSRAAGSLQNPLGVPTTV